jgi:hypothetical protein
MKSWKLLPMAMLLGIAWPMVSFAETDLPEIATDEVVMNDLAPLADEPESAVLPDAVDIAVEALRREADAEVPAAPQSDPQPVAPLDPARAIPGSETGSFAFGPLGVDANGRTGRIHLVAKGDTLWDISEAYLGTPWVWPSVWNENDEIANPHLIVPGDRIWISSTEMRRVTELEAEALVAAAQADAGPAEMLDAPEEVAEGAPAAMDEEPVAELMEPAAPKAPPQMITVSWKESMGFVSQQTLDAASSIVGSPSDRNWLSQGDIVYVGLGAGSVKVGDQFLVFEEIEAVRSVDGGRLVGYHIKHLGWLQITSVSVESSMATIEEAWHEMERGARVIARGEPTASFAVEPGPAGVRGHIVFMPSERTVMGTIDHVYLDIGASDGLKAGSQLDVIQSRYSAHEDVTGRDVLVPDLSTGKLVIISTQPRSSVALVQHTRNELEVGQTVTATTSMPASY